MTDVVDDYGPCECTKARGTIGGMCGEIVHTVADDGSKERWVCTRKMDHDGPHTACGPPDGHPIVGWDGDE